MKVKQKVKSNRLKVYENAKVLGLEFELDGETFKNLTIKTDIGSLDVTLESYSVYLYEAAMKKQYRVTVVDSVGIFPDLTKDFDDEYDRKDFVNSFDDEHGRFSLSLSEFEILAA